MVVINGYTIGPGADLTGADLSNRNLQNANLQGANLTNANLTNTNLQGANLQGANLTGTVFFNTVLVGANLTGTVVDNAVVSESSSNTHIFTENTISAQQNTIDYPIQSIVNKSITAFTTGTTDTYIRMYQLSSHLQSPPPNPVTRTFIGESYTQIATDDDSGESQNARITFQVLANVKYMIAFGCYGTQTNATTLHIESTSTTSGRNFRFANLTNAVLTGANLAGANLTGAHLTGVTSGNIQGTPASLPTNYKLVHGYIFGPYANLTYANFTDIDLKNQNWFRVNLTNAVLTGADLTGAYIESVEATYLTGVRSGNIIGQPGSLPPNYVMINGFILGPNMNLTNVDLSAADLSYANLTGANLSGANLSYANLSYANLSYANLSYANLNGANLTDANLIGANFTGVDLMSQSRLRDTAIYIQAIQDRYGIGDRYADIGNDFAHQLGRNHDISCWGCGDATISYRG